MATLFDVCAIVGAVVLILMFLSGLVGFDGDLDVDAVGSEISPGEGLNLFSIRALAAGVAFFGLTGGAVYDGGNGWALALLAGVLAGGVSMVAVALALRFMRGMEEDATPRIENAVGQTGRVYMQIPGARTGTGKVTVVVQGRTMEYRAETDDEPLKTGSTVRVTSVLGSDTVLVTPINDA